ncbi:PorT family protein [Flavobacteriaceae bacterium]|nr:PorT family protein [Flavobacteriaceae bacterium]MDA8947810.1 PorT family protein [Flavobacteriaceae bacterium]MDA9015618.1 PorT family protein [Flavobacteriaceae bacterium]MDA9571793.1 PorT family protein [Flavobacteriaceae bacterium]
MAKNLNILIRLKLFTFACLIANTTYSQYPQVRERLINLPKFDNKFIHYGYFLGVNQYDFKFEYIPNYYSELKYKDIVVAQKKGFSVGLIGDLRVNEYINLRFEPGLFYNRRELIFPEYSDFSRESDQQREIKSTFIHLPILLKISTKRINNFKPFIIGGFSTDFNLSSNQKNLDDNASNVFRTTSQNLNYELGLGFDFYLYYFKFSPSLRGIFSMQNELIPDNNPDSPWTGKINNMFSRGVALIITFE